MEAKKITLLMVESLRKIGWACTDPTDRPDGSANFTATRYPTDAEWRSGRQTEKSSRTVMPDGSLIVTQLPA